MVRRVYTEKKEGFDTTARQLKQELFDLFGKGYPEPAKPERFRMLRRYDVDRLDENQFKQVTALVLSEPHDNVFYGAEFPLGKDACWFGVEYGIGQYDERADAAEESAEIVAGLRPRIKIATIYVFENSAGNTGKPLSAAVLEKIKKYLINPVDSVETSDEIPLSLEDIKVTPHDVPVLKGFISGEDIEKLTRPYGFGMTKEDLIFCRDYFAKEGRDPTLAELRMIDTYWSDHCRHTTFNTILEEINVEGDGGLRKALRLYEDTRREVYGAGAEDRKRSLMDMATLSARLLKKKGLIPDLDESPEVNACTVKVRAEFADSKTGGNGGESAEPWLFLFKNETHNHPTEIEPRGGANTCLGGGIRDPLSGRAHVHQAMRITGGGDPGTAPESTLPGKLPQIKIAHEAAAGYSSYGNCIGLAGGQVAEFYHDGFLAKRMELGALVGAAPEAWVRREEPAPGDLVILVGAKTGRDGIGGATGSSGAPGGKKIETNGAGVPKGDAAEERKIVRLFRKSEACRLIKRCNDFGAGGVSVAVGEISGGLDINLDAVPVKYPGLDGTELAISESQERMAVVVSSKDADEFIRMAADENLDAVIIAKVTVGNLVTAQFSDAKKAPRLPDARLRMFWRGKTIVDISREFLSSNGIPRRAKVLLKANPAFNSLSSSASPQMLLDNLKSELSSLRSGSRRGLQEQFDTTNGSYSVLFPFGGKEQGTPECGMAALLPSQEKHSLTASLMSFGYDPDLMSIDTYTGAKGAVLEALAKFACLGGDPFKAWLSMQEYFEKPVNPETWGKPAAALLGALEAQIRLGVPAIGGKDSMSGNYTDEANGINLTVPPTLVAFAAGTVRADRIQSGALKGEPGNLVVLLSQPAAEIANAAGAADEWERFKNNMEILRTLAASGALKASYPVGSGGVSAALALMAFGNMTGVEAYAESFSQISPLNYQGSVLAEINEAALGAGLKNKVIVAAKTLSKPVFRIVMGNESAEASLDELRRLHEKALLKVYPQTSAGKTVAEKTEAPALKLPALNAGADIVKKNTRLSKHAAPVVIIPVFPNTNGEWDMERAFREAGAKTSFVIFKNRSGDETAASFKELASAIKNAQIIALSGGYTDRDEPGGSGQFIANVLRSPQICGGIDKFLSESDGLILGIASGFEALVKTGLVPYGRIVNASASMPVLAVNAVGRYVSRMVRTRVMPNISPWLSFEEAGTVHIIPTSHSKGRMVIGNEEAQALFSAGQVPFCYADAEGNPTMAEPDNPNGSAFAIESLASPDGRILGKMCHSERYGKFVNINIPGNKRQRIFEAGVRYFQNL